MTPPASSARALYNILEAVQAKLGAESAYHAWKKVAGAEVTTAPFAVFYTETFALLQEVIAGLSPEEREFYAEAIRQWYLALAHPRKDWATVKPTVIGRMELIALGGLARETETKARAQGPHHPDEVAVLRGGVRYLLAQLEDISDVPLPVRDQIVADLRHVLWLLDNVDTFGVQHARKAAEAVSGRVTTVAAGTKSPSLRRAAVALVAVLALAAGPVGDVASLTESVRSVFALGQDAETDADVTVVVKTIYNECTPKALPPGCPEEDGEDIEDAEIVSEEDG